MESKRMIRWGGPLAAVLLAATTFAGCGGDDDSAGSSGGGGAEHPSLRIGVTQTAAVGPVWVADINGYFEDAGLDVELVNFRAATDLITAGSSGSLDLMATGVEQPAFLAESHAGDWQDISALLGSSAFSIVSQPDLDIEPGDLEALEGLTIGIPGQGRPAHSVVKELLRQVGLDPETDVEYVEQPAGAEGIPAWERGLADVAVVNEPVTSALLQRDSAEMFLDLRTGEHGPISQVPQAAVLAPVSLIESDPETLELFVGAICRAANAGNEDPEGVSATLAESWAAETGTDAGVLESGLVIAAESWTAELAVEPVEAWLELLVGAGTLQEDHSYDDVVDDSFSEQWEC